MPSSILLIKMCRKSLEWPQSSSPALHCFPCTGHIHNQIFFFHLSSLIAPQISTHISTISFEVFILPSNGHHIIARCGCSCNTYNAYLGQTSHVPMLDVCYYDGLYNHVKVTESLFRPHILHPTRVVTWFQSHNSVSRQHSLMGYEDMFLLETKCVAVHIVSHLNDS